MRAGALVGPLAAAGSEGLASMWRIELLHPAIVHFPVALTLVAALFYLLARLGRWRAALSSFDAAAALLLVLAALSAWAAVQSGHWADEVVGRGLYDPRPLEDHERFATLLAWLLSGAALVELGRRHRRVPAPARRAGLFVVGLALLVSSGLVAYVGHLGSSLVYQQGAGVIMPGG